MIFQMTLKIYGTIQFKTEMTRKTFLVKYSGIIKETKIQIASGFQSGFILNSTSIFLTWKVLKYIIQGMKNFKTNRLLKIFTYKKWDTWSEHPETSVSASLSILPVPTYSRHGKHSRVLNSSLTYRRKQLPTMVFKYPYISSYYF